MRYIPHTPEEVGEMLAAIGAKDLAELFSAIPDALKLGRPLAVPSAMSEPDLMDLATGVAARNVASSAAVSFLGGGVYQHLRPVAADQLLLRGELYTAYTPYQPEVAQGTLQIVFEFQSMVAELLDMEVVNASMYDGSTALAEALLMAARVKRKRRCLVAGTLHPEYREVCEVYARSGALDIEILPVRDDGTVDLDRAEAIVADAGKDIACLAVGYPTFYGTLDDVARASELAHRAGALSVVCFQEAMAFGLLTPPGALGADIVVGEGQSLGVPPSMGGPHLGLFACTSKLVRKMPGRLAGQTLDSRGQRGFVLTMSTREQHIRRERATSNICTNEGLMATAATIFMALLGPEGLGEVARACHLRAEATRRALSALPGYELAHPGPTFHEFVLRTPRDAERISEELAAEGIAPGLPLSRWEPERTRELLVCATELTSEEDIATLRDALARYHP